MKEDNCNICHRPVDIDNHAMPTFEEVDTDGNIVNVCGECITWIIGETFVEFEGEFHDGRTVKFYMKGGEMDA